MNLIFFFLFFIFTSTYTLSYISVLYTESFVLFLSFFTIFIYAINNTSYKITYTKDDFKWNEIILFYISLKNWNRYIIRDRSVKIFNFLDLVIQIKKYQILWLNKNISKLENRDIFILVSKTSKRLDLLKRYRGARVNLNPINYFTFSN
jgi:hypothetical protein